MMTEFNKGWWNCLCTFADEMGENMSTAVRITKQVLINAGVTPTELNNVIDNATELGVPDGALEILEEIEECYD